MEQDTRSIILETALELFSRRGYESAGVAEIVDRADITKPTLYYYFGSKQGLLEAIIREYGERLAELFRSAAAYRHDLVMNLRELFRANLRFSHEKPDFWRLMLIIFSSAADSEAYQAGAALRRELLAVLETLFENAAKDHGNMKKRHKIYAESFLGLMETFTRLSVNGELSINEDLRSRIIHQYMHGIFS
jgi:TetR/AcrR family transcriptional regulator